MDSTRRRMEFLGEYSSLLYAKRSCSNVEIVVFMYTTENIIPNYGGNTI